MVFNCVVEDFYEKVLLNDFPGKILSYKAVTDTKSCLDKLPYTLLLLKRVYYYGSSYVPPPPLIGGDNNKPLTILYCLSYKKGLILAADG